MAQAVVEFDEAVQAPWRPPLAGGPVRRGQLRAVPDQAGPRVAVPPGAGRSPAGLPVHGRRPSAARPGRPLPSAPAARRPVPGRGVERPAAPALRLTRRARRLGVVLGLAVGVVVGSWVGSVVSDDGGLRLAGASSVVVQSGDTLWSIAASVAGSGDDVRAVVAEIRELNGLADASIAPGQTLVLP
ncbi:LysM peptidoglycan-binding domain-containing protein [Blastococcus sp. TML/C7B]|uniref:LysM peptidoglycan-binding domain-containing protein n=1 Tax=Blastococcus sp. TML/C7B TaxID=2798728 RepID=UPI00281650B6|nr:LysM peptidoglycan-binding domain-containing protein [Blastococcus sp. TML/C7B]